MESTVSSLLRTSKKQKKLLICMEQIIFILVPFMCEALLIGILGVTSGVLIGIGRAHLLSGIAPHQTSGPGGGFGGGVGPPAHVNPIVIPNDLLYV